MTISDSADDTPLPEGLLTTSREKRGQEAELIRQDFVKSQKLLDPSIGRSPESNAPAQK